MSSSLATHHKKLPTKTPYQWEEVLGAAQAGQWEEGVRPVLYKVHPGHRQQLFSLALDQQNWDVLLALLCQGFGNGRLEEVVNAAMADPDGWEFLHKAVQNRCEVFPPSLLQKMFTTASQQRLWVVLAHMTFRMTKPAMVMLFDILLALDLPGQPGQAGDLSATAKRYILIIRRMFHVRKDYRLGFDKIKREVEVSPDGTEAKVKRKIKIVLDFKRRCQLFEQILDEYIKTRHKDLEEAIVSNLVDCPGYLQEQFFQLTAKEGRFLVAFEVTAALSKHTQTTLAAVRTQQEQDSDVNQDQEGAGITVRRSRRKQPDVTLLIKDAERSVERWTTRLFQVATDNQDCHLFAKLRDLATRSPVASVIWKEHVRQYEDAITSMAIQAFKKGRKLKLNSRDIQVYESLTGKKVQL